MNATVNPALPAPVLCVDLDGTLVKSDTLVDSICALARNKPLALLRAPLWLLRGKAGFKAAIASEVELDTAHLPLNQTLLAYLREQHAAGRPIYLATGADGALAHRVAADLGIFAGVLSSDGSTNLTGHNKLNAFRERFKDGFDYIGNASPDVPLLQSSVHPMTANPDWKLRALLKSKGVTIARNFQDKASTFRAFTKAVRVHQWAKNALIFVPMLLAHSIETHHIVNSLLAFLCFSLLASSTYILNDLLDIEADRRHPKKRRRPFAAGDLAASTGLLISMAFIGVSLAVATILLPQKFLVWLLVYFATTLAYSLVLKRKVLVDVIVLSGLYTLRILAGAAATSVIVSHWLGGFSIFFFLSLAMVKRFSELNNLRAQGNAPTNGRGYLLEDIEQIRTFGSASAYASVVVFTLYINSDSITSLYQHAYYLWLIVPLLIWWISRVWLLASRGQLDEDPVVFALTDRASLAAGVVLAVIAVFSAL